LRRPMLTSWWRNVGLPSFFRAVLRGIEQLAGTRSPNMRARARYLSLLAEEGRLDEAAASLRHGLRKRMRKWLPNRAPPIHMDARLQRLGPDGQVMPKRSWVWPGPDAEILVSVIIPCYNYGHFLLEAVNSVRAQTIASREIIVVDDGSTDLATVALVEQLRAAPDLRIVRQTNMGLPSARNAGIAVAKGEFICCLDADDLLEPTYLECMVSQLLMDRSAGFACSHVRLFGDIDEVWETHDFDIDEAMVANFTAVSAVFRRDDWAEIGGYAPEMRGGYEDWEFWIRLACLGRRGRVVTQALFLHRRHGRTMTHEAREISRELRARIRTRNERVFSCAALRRRLLHLAAPPGQDVNDALVPLSAAVSSDTRPGLLVVLEGNPILEGIQGALREAASRWRPVLVVSDGSTKALLDRFRPPTSEVFQLSAHGAEHEQAAFLRHICRSRGIAHGLFISGGVPFANRPALRDEVRALRWVGLGA
jgi:GT2 family glycosyltransferase